MALAVLVAVLEDVAAATTTRTMGGCRDGCRPRLGRRGGCLSWMMRADEEAALPKRKLAARGNVTWVKLPNSETTLLSLRIHEGHWTIKNDSVYPIRFSLLH
ncbi:hypothetical protein VP01_697g8 [Puccinia sorghi]|uniref:Uncharacterized protein n=1 Tax=Puccinia sorghi TaxID=27349 RepID=A0A0L6UDX2_9BASI|nr:hypothetical protein VP01_697g8 [Puccinia sorghi]